MSSSNNTLPKLVNDYLDFCHYTQEEANKNGLTEEHDGAMGCIHVTTPYKFSQMVEE